MLATLAQLRDYLGVDSSTEDSRLNLFLEFANQTVKTYIGRDLESQEYTQKFDGEGQRFLVLPNYPVTDIASIEVNIGTLDTPDFDSIGENTYKLNPNIGQINFISPMERGFQNYKVVYTAGYETIPADIVMAVLKLAAKYWNTRTTDGIKSESVNGDRLDYDVSQIPSDVLVVLDSYKEVNV